MVDNLSPEDRSWCMSQIRSRDMKPEIAVRSMVHRLGYRFRLHRRDLPGAPDLVLSRHRAVIFVNGCFWHWHPDPECPIAGLPKSNLQYWKPKLSRTRTRDKENTDSLKAEGWRVLTVWECQLRAPVDVLHGVRVFLARAQDETRRTLDCQIYAPGGTVRALANEMLYPSSIDNVELRSLFDSLKESPFVAEPQAQYDAHAPTSKRETTVLALDHAIRRATRSGWRGKRSRETAVRKAIKRMVKEDSVADTIFRIVKSQDVY